MIKKFLAEGGFIMQKYAYDYKKSIAKPVNPDEFFRLKELYPHIKIDRIEPPKLGVPGFGKIFVLLTTNNNEQEFAEAR